MAALNAEGIILRKQELRETSFILVLFTKEYGKVRGVIKGVRNPYLQFAGDMEIFTLSRISFYKKRKSTLDLITQCEAIGSFPNIRKDIERLTCASYFIELIDNVTSDYDVNEALYNVLYESLRLLDTDCSAKRATRIFELKTLEAIGLVPQLNECVKCSSPVSGDRQKQYKFGISSGGILCADCLEGQVGAISISRGAINFMSKILQSPFEKLAQIKVSKEVGGEIEEVLEGFIRFHITRTIKSLKFLKEIESIKAKSIGKKKVRMHG